LYHLDECPNNCKKPLSGCHHLCGLKCGHTGACECKEACDVSTCAHGTCPAPCGEECPRCDMPCAIRCVHSQCSKKCYEPCDRFACDERCPLRLKCGCQCTGLCGEPCVPCRIHESHYYAGLPTKKTHDKRLYFLPCGHIHTVQDLDEAIGDLMTLLSRRRSLSVTVKCPKDGCDQIMTLENAPRYQLVIKQVIERRREAARQEYSAQPSLMKERDRDRLEDNMTGS
ncbi:hypothetical protein KIPB_010806, partial [Kipferlia bialata]